MENATLRINLTHQFIRYEQVLMYVLHTPVYVFQTTWQTLSDFSVRIMYTVYIPYIAQCTYYV